MVEIREQSMHETLFKLFPKLNKPTNGIGMTEIITFFLPLIMASTSPQNLSIFSTLISRCLGSNHACNSWAFIILFLLCLLSNAIHSRHRQKACGLTSRGGATPMQTKWLKLFSKLHYRRDQNEDSLQ